jgi:hypothetical protein
MEGAIIPLCSTAKNAAKYLDEFVRPRLEKNFSLARRLALVPAGANIPFREQEELRRLYGFIVMGLAYIHWRVLLPDVAWLVALATAPQE